MGTASAGIKKGRSPDIAVILFDRPAATAATFTQNKFVAAPVTLAREHLADCRGRTKAWIINSGNANCGTGKRGYRVARDSCKALAAAIDTQPEKVLPFSTGVIMEQIPDGLLGKGATLAARKPAQKNWADAARAIMTTDTKPKGASVRLNAKGSSHVITGIAKGSGMIHPDMATMLAFIATDANLPVAPLRRHLRDAVSQTFNAISVDGDTSTNDAVALAATGMAGRLTQAEQKRFGAALLDLCFELAHQIVLDGEGATCTATVCVRGLRSDAECRMVADSVACSPLVKTMLHARDPNIGRLLMAVGKSRADLDPAAIVLKFNGKTAYTSGTRAKAFTEKVARRCFAKPPLFIEVALGKKKTQSFVTFTDLSCDYVRINSDYRS